MLYGDFRKATFHQMVTFLYGCGATFAGVFILTWTRSSSDSDEDEQEGGEGEQGGEVTGMGLDNMIDNDNDNNEGGGSVRMSRTKARMIRRARSSTTLMGLSPAQVSNRNNIIIKFIYI